jgi:hypothetical protein
VLAALLELAEDELVRPDRVLLRRSLARTMRLEFSAPLCIKDWRFPSKRPYPRGGQASPHQGLLPPEKEAATSQQDSARLSVSRQLC